MYVKWLDVNELIRDVTKAAIIYIEKEQENNSFGPFFKKEDTNINNTSEDLCLNSDDKIQYQSGEESIFSETFDTCFAEDINFCNEEHHSNVVAIRDNSNSSNNRIIHILNEEIGKLYYKLKFGIFKKPMLKEITKLSDKYEKTVDMIYIRFLRLYGTYLDAVRRTTHYNQLGKNYIIYISCTALTFRANIKKISLTILKDINNVYVNKYEQKMFFEELFSKNEYGFFNKEYIYECILRNIEFQQKDLKDFTFEIIKNSKESYYDDNICPILIEEFFDGQRIEVIQELIDSYDMFFEDIDIVHASKQLDLWRRSHLEFQLFMDIFKNPLFVTECDYIDLIDVSNCVDTLVDLNSSDNIQLQALDYEYTDAEREDPYLRQNRRNRDKINSERAIEMWLNYFFKSNCTETNVKKLRSLADDVIWLMYSLKFSENIDQVLTAVLGFAKLRTGRPLQIEFWEYYVELLKKIFCFGAGIQYQSDIGDLLQNIRAGFNNFEEFKNTDLYKKCYRAFLYLLSCSVLEDFGIKFDSLGYSKMEAEALKNKYYKGVNMYYVLLDTLTFLCERGYQIIKSGDIQMIFHSSKSYGDWFEKNVELERKSKLLNDPELYGFTESSFLRDLDINIEQGENIFKYACESSKYDKKLVLRQLEKLKFIKNEYLTSENAGKNRKCPFSVLIFGNSNIGKSTIKEILFKQFSIVRNLELNDNSIYTKNPVAEFWDQFRTHMWGLVLDDIAFLNPNMGEVDPSVSELLQVINNIPYVPNQAALEDKGRIPFRGQFVVGTTNTSHLNSYHYFSCPSAVQRRFPFIIEPCVRPEFCCEDGMSLDSTKISYPENGYPDWWTFKILKIDPRPANSKDKLAKPIPVFEHDLNLKEFLIWFNSAIKRHFDTQQDIVDSCQKIRKLEYCKICLLPNNSCECELQSLVNSYYNYWKSLIVLNIDKVFFVINEMSWINFDETSRINIFIVWIASIFGHNIEASIIRRLGEKTQAKIGANPLIIIIGTIISLGLVRELYKFFKNTWKAKSTMNFEADTSSIGTFPVKDEFVRANVWFNDKYQVTDFDIPRQISSLKNCDPGMIHTIFRNNQFRAILVRENGIAVHNNIVGLKGHFYLINNHAVPKDIQYIKIISGPVQHGVTSNNLIKINKDKDIVRFPDRDLAIIILKQRPPVKDITQFFATENYEFKSAAKMLTRNDKGIVIMQHLQMIELQKNMRLPGLNIDVDIWKYKGTTAKGDCGSLVIALAQVGPCIVGFHELAAEDKGIKAALRISKEFLDIMLNETESRTNEFPNISEGEIELNSKNSNLELGELHHKSPFRYLEQGSAHVYGSFKGFRMKPKSRVKLTPGCEYVCEKLNIEVKYTKPVMGGWRPWYIAAQDMVKIPTIIDNDILIKCRNSFYKDIISGISKDSLSKLQVYCNEVAINGCNGVLYVDKMNRFTSAGNPYKKSKQYYIFPTDGNEIISDPYDVVDEIKERIDYFHDMYLSGKRARPCFCAHLKDEPVSFKKAEMGKTRVFTGAPFDWSILCRKYFLSCVRVVQLNKLLFEAGPGLICQSLEWHGVGEYLSQFGSENMIAGDYKSFDKKLSPAITLAAFDILISLCKESGNFSDEDILVMQGIAEDVAYPLIDFNGDLVQFFGSNPSGHPLTVIINNIANSLYQRYAYYVNNPNKECESFKSNVAAINYGDDMVCGVSDRTPWFNHTSMASALADIGVVFTMADKEAESVPYIKFHEVSFLKRIFKFDDRLGCFVCPLDKDSIEKMLTVWTESKNVVWQEQYASVICSANREMFYYGKEEYDEFQTILKGLVNYLDIESYINESTFPTWETLASEFMEHSTMLIL
jgi:hypothetical protein